MAPRNEPFRQTKLTLTAILLLASICSLFLPYIETTINAVPAERIPGLEYAPAHIPFLCLLSGAIFLLAGKRRRAAYVASAASGIATLLLLYIYREIHLMGYKYRVAPGFRLVIVPGIGFTIFAGCSIVLFFVSVLTVRRTLPSRGTNHENELIDEIPEAED